MSRKRTIVSLIKELSERVAFGRNVKFQPSIFKKYESTFHWYKETLEPRYLGRRERLLSVWDTAMA